MFKKTQALYKLLELKNRVRIVCGGTSAGKTICILLILIQDSIKNKGREVSVVASTVPALRRGVLKDFLKIMKTTNRYKVLIKPHLNTLLVMAAI
jgi:phage terminase large subunit